MKTLWERSKDLANMVGLTSGAVGLIIIAYQINDIYLWIAGLISFAFFVFLLLMMIGLLFRDLILYRDKM